MNEKIYVGQEVELEGNGVKVTNEVMDVARATSQAWKWWHNPKVARHIKDGGMNEKTYTESLVELGKKIRAGDSNHLILSILYDDKVTGLITLTINGKDCEIYLVTNETGWKQGKATIAAGLTLDYLFKHGVDNVYISYPPSNKPARNFFGRFGFTTRMVIQSLNQETFYKVIESQKVEDGAEFRSGVVVGQGERGQAEIEADGNQDIQE